MSSLKSKALLLPLSFPETFSLELCSPRSKIDTRKVREDIQTKKNFSIWPLGGGAEGNSGNARIESFSFGCLPFVTTPLLSIIFDILKAPDFQKYSTCWEFFSLCLCLQKFFFLKKSYFIEFALSLFLNGFPSLIYRDV